MNFGSTDRTVFESNGGTTFALSPPTFAISFAEKRQDPDACANRDCFNVSDFSGKLKVHPCVLWNILLNNGFFLKAAEFAEFGVFLNLKCSTLCSPRPPW